MIVFLGLFVPGVITVCWGGSGWHASLQPTAVGLFEKSAKGAEYGRALLTVGGKQPPPPRRDHH